MLKGDADTACSIGYTVRGTALDLGLCFMSSKSKRHGLVISKITEPKNDLSLF